MSTTDQPTTPRFRAPNLDDGDLAEEVKLADDNLHAALGLQASGGVLTDEEQQILHDSCELVSIADLIRKGVDVDTAIHMFERPHVWTIGWEDGKFSLTADFEDDDGPSEPTR